METGIGTLPKRAHLIPTLAVITALSGVWGPVAQAQTPLSAIDWLDRQSDLTLPVVPDGTAPTIDQAGLPTDGQDRLGQDPMGQDLIPPIPTQPPVADRVATPQVETLPLAQAEPGAVGLLPGAVTGLPPWLWQGSKAEDLTRHVSHLDLTRLPALQSLLITMLLAEAEPPQEQPGQKQFLLARLDNLQRLGAVDPALALVERADPAQSGDLFARWLDLSLLMGRENIPCRDLRANGALAPSTAAQVYCLANAGDWNTANLTYGTAAALGSFSNVEKRLLGQFLNADLAEDSPQLPPPSSDKTTPLIFRLSEAIGQPIPTTGLPRAFANADLRGHSGWRSELEAAERLTRSGALAANRLLGYYTARKPAASGGIWDRVAAVQRLDQAIEAGNVDKVIATLPSAWDEIRKARLEIPFADLWAGKLAELDLKSGADTDKASLAIAYDMALLSPEYESLTRKLAPQTADQRFLATLAIGEPKGDLAQTPVQTAIARAFAPGVALPETTRRQLQNRELGAAILTAMDYLATAAGGEMKDIQPGLATLRAVGLEDPARRSALQLILLERGS